MDVKANFINLHINGTDSNFTILKYTAIFPTHYGGLSKVLNEEDKDFFKGNGGQNRSG